VTAEPVFSVSRPWFPAQVDLRVSPASASGHLKLPLEPNTASGGDPEVLWLGPDEWLFIRHSPDGGAASLMEDLERNLEGVHHSAVDVSANRAAFDLFGTHRLEVLSKGCGLDLHPRRWSAGRCAQTLLARVPVILHERAAMTRVLVRPSFVPFLDRWFAAAAPR
jgi:sarcosine oxidase, subunit gamma